MTTVFVAERPPEIESWLTRRHELGQDRYDEVWKGVYHVAPGPSLSHAVVDSEVAAALRPRAKRAGLTVSTAFNVGELDDFRVPDAGVHRHLQTGVFVDTAAMVIEVVSPGDESYAKFDFYARHGVDEVLIADPALRSVRIWQLHPADRDQPAHYEETGLSELLTITAAEIADEISWP
jgi:Uma2 family endonuclease